MMVEISNKNHCIHSKNSRNFCFYQMEPFRSFGDMRLCKIIPFEQLSRIFSSHHCTQGIELPTPSRCIVLFVFVVIVCFVKWLFSVLCRLHFSTCFGFVFVPKPGSKNDYKHGTLLSVVFSFLTDLISHFHC